MVKDKPFMIQTEQVENCSMEIMDTDEILNCLVPKFIGSAVDTSTLNTSASQPNGETVGTVVPPRVLSSLRQWQASVLRKVRQGLSAGFFQGSGLAAFKELIASL